MNPRVVFTIVLVSLGVILAFLPSSETVRFKASPGVLLKQALSDSCLYSSDDVARFIANQDSSLLLIDLRTEKEFRELNIPGSVNIPYTQILNKERHLDTYFSNPKTKVIFYSNGDVEAAYSLIIARGLGYNNAYVMKGGLNAWFATVINTTFHGDHISARENALFEARTRAKDYFIRMNSLPDSLKIKFAQKSKFDPKKLDGGCE